MDAPSVLVAPSFPPTLGGVETMLYETARRLRPQPLVVAPQPAAAPDLRVMAVAPPRTSLVERLAYRLTWPVHPALYYFKNFLRPLARAVRSEKPSVLQCGHVYLAPVVWAVACRAHVPFIVYIHGQEVWREGRRVGIGALDGVLRGAALRAATNILVAGTFTARLMRAWDVEPGRILTVPYGAEPRAAPAPEPESPRLLSVARLVPRKGIDITIRALPQVAAAFPAVSYQVVGAGPDADRLRRIARDAGVAERVSFLKDLDSRALAAQYRDCSLFVLPVRRTADGELEGFGLVYLEAAAWGKASVAGRSGGEMDAVIDGTTGVLVNGESIDEVASTLVRLLHDRQARERLGRAGWERVTTTSNWESAARVVQKALEAATSS